MIVHRRKHPDAYLSLPPVPLGKSDNNTDTSDFRSKLQTDILS